MIIPRRLQPGDLIAITAPASPLALEQVIKAKNQLRAWGFQVKIGSTCFQEKGYLAGLDEDRGRELNHFFNDNEVKGILCLRGGYGSLRILQELDYDMIKKNPKIFIGFSDITALHIALQQQCQLVTFHGPMAAQIANGLDPLSSKSLFKVITEDKALGVMNHMQQEEMDYLVAGMGEGEIVGGNLTLITATLGTPYELETKNKLLFIEEIGEEAYRIDRMFTQLKLAGKFSEVAGIILGDFNHSNSIEIFSLIREELSLIGKPVLKGLRAGHCTPNLTIPLGVKARLSSQDNTFEILEGAVLA